MSKFASLSRLIFDEEWAFEGRDGSPNRPDVSVTRACQRMEMRNQRKKNDNWYISCEMVSLSTNQDNEIANEKSQSVHLHPDFGLDDRLHALAAYNTKVGGG